MSRSPTKAQTRQAQFEATVPLNDRMALLRKKTGVNNADVEEYKRTELLRKSVNDVKLRAADARERRESPSKTYSGVKSKIAGNMKSQKKAKKMNSLVDEQKYVHAQVLAGNMDVITKTQVVYEGSPHRNTEIQRKAQEIDGLRQDIEQRRMTQQTFIPQTVPETQEYEPSQYTVHEAERRMTQQTSMPQTVPEAREYEPSQYTVHEATSINVGRVNGSAAPVDSDSQKDSSRIDLSGQKPYKSAYAQDKTHMRKIASATKTRAFKSKKSMATMEGSQSFVETPANFGATPAGAGIDAGFGETTVKSIRAGTATKKSTTTRIKSASAAKGKKKSTIIATNSDVYQSYNEVQQPVVAQQTLVETRTYTQEQTSPIRKKASPIRNNNRQQLHNASSLELGNGREAAGMFRNEELERKIAAVQDEFNALLAQKGPVRRTHHGTDDMEMDNFYKVMGEFYDKSKVPKHESPTRRLMDQQKAAWDSKAVLYKKSKAGEIDMQDYSITYVVDPKRTFVVQPREGEINYDTAFKNPNRFYDKVMSQDVLEHKVSMKSRTEVVQGSPTHGGMPMMKKKSRGLEMTSRITKRAVARILIAVNNKLNRMLTDLMADEHDPEYVKEALAHPQTKGVVQRHIQNRGIKLVEPKSNATIYKAQMSLIGAKGERAITESPEPKYKGDDETIDVEDARLDADEAAINEVAQTVNNLIRSNSLQSQQQQQRR